MPWKSWKHFCLCWNTYVTRGSEICDDCHQAGEYDGPRYSMHEAMGAYQNRTGLKSIGPHRKLADELFEARFQACERCQGRGVLDFELGRGYILCEGCQGNGFIFEGTPSEWQAIRQKISLTFPDALFDPIVPGGIGQVVLYNPLPSELGRRLEY